MNPLHLNDGSYKIMTSAALVDTSSVLERLLLDCELIGEFSIDWLNGVVVPIGQGEHRGGLEDKSNEG